MCETISLTLAVHLGQAEAELGLVPLEEGRHRNLPLLDASTAIPSFTVLEARASFASRKLRFMLSVVR
jgi:hypothetical protein